MKPQTILKSSAVSTMRQRVASADSALDVYRSAASFPEIGESDLLATPIFVPDAVPALVMPTGNAQQIASTDFENAVLVFEYLRDLTRTQATDPRLWVTLAHTTFWRYVHARWGESATEALRTAVLRHWFVPDGGKASLRTHAISRLWWAAYLTYAPWERDPDLAVFKTADRFHYTRVLLKQQQIYFDVIERDFGSDARIRTCILDAFDRYLPLVTYKDGLSRDSSKQLNLLVKHRQLASLELADLRKACDDLVARVAASLGSAATGGSSTLAG